MQASWTQLGKYVILNIGSTVIIGLVETIIGFRVHQELSKRIPTCSVHSREAILLTLPGYIHFLSALAMLAFLLWFIFYFKGPNYTYDEKCRLSTHYYGPIMMAYGFALLVTNIVSLVELFRIPPICINIHYRNVLLALYILMNISSLHFVALWYLMTIQQNDVDTQMWCGEWRLCWFIPIGWVGAIGVIPLALFKFVTCTKLN